MFTGLVSAVGEVLAVEERAQGLRRVSIAASYDAASIAIGASIACSGICLTVVAVAPRGMGSTFDLDVASETLNVTTAGRWQIGTRLNLERSLKIGDELGGHIVCGHVDGLAELLVREDLPHMARLELRAPAPLARFIAAKGSVALDGVSLTVNTVEDDRFSVLIIPHTLAVTTLGATRGGAMLNLEIDLMARYAARLLECR